MRCIHHVDDDGLCSAAIVGLYCYDRIMERDDFIPYNYEDTINLPDINPGEQWYIVDLCLNRVLLETIKTLVENDCKVVYIDHHQSGIDFFESLSDEEKSIIDNPNVIFYWDTDCSGSLATWIYISMDDAERKHPASINWNYPENKEPKYGIFQLSSRPEGWVISIPLIVRYVNDYDIWKFNIPDTKAFHVGFECETDKHPMADIWKTLFANDSGSRLTINQIINNGRANIEYQKSLYHTICDKGFPATIKVDDIDYNVYVCNSPIGNSSLFGDKLNEYDMCIAYHFNGTDAKFSFYSRENGMHVNEFAEKFGGGGHPHAAGCSSEELFWMINPCSKNE